MKWIKTCDNSYIDVECLVFSAASELGGKNYVNLEFINKSFALGPFATMDRAQEYLDELMEKVEFFHKE